MYDLDSDPDAPADIQRLQIVGEAFPDAIFGCPHQSGRPRARSELRRELRHASRLDFGWQRTMEALLHYVRNGSDAEKWGAVNALYHASVAWKPPYGPVQIDAPTCERFGALIGEEMLRQFVQTNDLALLQTIVRWLRPVDAYPPRLRDLARRAHEIARNHPDEFVRTVEPRSASKARLAFHRCLPGRAATVEPLRDERPRRSLTGKQPNVDAASATKRFPCGDALSCSLRSCVRRTSERYR